MLCCFFFLQAEDGIRDLVRSRGLGDVYKRQVQAAAPAAERSSGAEGRAAAPVRETVREPARQNLSLIHI